MLDMSKAEDTLRGYKMLKFIQIYILYIYHSFFANSTLLML